MSRVKVDITADKSGFDAAIKGVNRSFEDLKGLVAGAFTIEAIKSFTENTIEFAEQITNAAMRLNMTVEQLQVLKQAAKDNGVEFEKLESSLEKVSVAKERALRGDTKALSYFSQLGISKQDLKQNRSADLVFGKISAAVSSKNVESITEPLRKILGNSFGELMPLLKTNITEVSDKLQAMGAIMDTDTAVKLRVIGEQFKGLGTILITLLAPAIVSLVESMEQAIEARNNAIQKANQIENEVKVAKMELEKSKIEAEGNRVKSQGLSKEILTEKWINAIRYSNNKIIITDGKTPVILQ